MATLIFNNIRKAKHTFDITINIPDEDQDPYWFKLIELGEFEYGNNNKEENVYYPPNTDIEFTVMGGSVGDSQVSETYFMLLNSLSKYGGDVIINKDNNYYFKGFVDTGSIGSDYKEKSINIDVVSDFAKIKEMAPDPEYLGYTNVDIYVLYHDVIKKIINLALPGVTNWVGELTDVCATTTIMDISGNNWVPDFQNFGTWKDFLFSPIMESKTLYELLVSILSNYGLIVQIKGNTAYLQQRWNITGTVEDIELDAIIDGPNFEEFIPKFDGVRARVRCGNNPVYQVDESNGIVDVETNNFEEIVFHNAGGSFPIEYGQNDVLIYVPEEEVGLGNGGWNTLDLDVFFIKSDSDIAQYALWSVVSEKVFKHINEDRVIYSCTMRGTNFINNQIYRLPNFANLYFRPRKYKVNYTTNTTEVEFIKISEGDGTQLPNPFN
jgi:hypothetical protein